MSSYKLTNISGGQIVCDLAVEGKTLRLNNRQTKTIKDTEMTSHISNLVKKGLMMSEEIPVTKTKKKSANIAFLPCSHFLYKTHRRLRRANTVRPYGIYRISVN